MSTIASTDALKKAVAVAAIERLPRSGIIGVGTGSTANHFIDEFAKVAHQFDGAVASSEATAARLKQHGIEVFDLNSAGNLAVYVDGADEINPQQHLIKGGGGALTREKIVAAASAKFICIADSSKSVEVLGEYPLPVEVIPMARSFIGRQMVELGGDPELRDDYVTDNGNIILDVYNLNITDPRALETQINQIPGVVTVGLFAHRPADVVLLSHADGTIEERQR